MYTVLTICNILRQLFGLLGAATVTGDENKVTGVYSKVTGDKNLVTGDSSVVTGDENHVTGTNTTVINMLFILFLNV